MPTTIHRQNADSASEAVIGSAPAMTSVTDSFLILEYPRHGALHVATISGEAACSAGSSGNLRSTNRPLTKLAYCTYSGWS